MKKKKKGKKREGNLPPQLPRGRSEKANAIASL